LAPHVRVPASVSRQFPEQNVSTHADYSPTTHPRKRDASADAQRIIDGLVNPGGSGGVPERALYDGGFRVGRDRKLHGNEVVDALKATSEHYVNLSEREAAAGNIELSGQYRDQAIKVARAQTTYASTLKAYWSGIGRETPPDVVERNGGGEAPIGIDGRTLPVPQKAVGK
jgi:hypothetical protein